MNYRNGQQTANIKKNKSSKYKGVVFQNRKFVSQITYDRVRQYLGTFNLEIEAAMAYDEAAILLYGKEAVTNQMIYPKDFKK